MCFDLVGLLANRGKLNDLCGLNNLTSFRALAIEAMPRDSDGMMQIVKLFRIELDSFLSAPTETVSPSRIF